ncbi:MAG TPA: hypothetical protein DIW30_01845 [Bacteroidales bacterium]|nr:hypothetical protein [Bacteroidales bacterium]
MIRYQGESIDFQIEISGDDKWSNYTKVIVYLYTHTSRIAKFAYKGTDTTYLKLTSQYNRFLNGTLPAEYTKTMRGALYCDVVAYKDDKKYHIKARTTGLQIHYTPIKQEV